MRSCLTVRDFRTFFTEYIYPFIGRIYGAWFGLFIKPPTGIFWGWKHLQVHPSAIFQIERNACIELGGQLQVGYFVKPDIPLPGQYRAGLVIKSDGTFKAGKNVKLSVGAHVHVSNHAVVEIGTGTFLSYNSQIVSRKKISIGENCAIGWNVTILDSQLHHLEHIPYAEAVIIGSRVWIGHNVSILQGTHIGDGAIIGANSTVTKSIPPNCLAVGSPAKVIRENISWQA